jgi:hypothetical protein
LELLHTYFPHLAHALGLRFSAQLAEEETESELAPT